ncbi:c-type cytochrome biogenesis protein CcsB [Paucibacter sp. DJ2R-2]|uniref:c-type cytochrome biogenesis protein CcsB n=1 Tax=Paucibacter sp. DJ2R-2 TaxID=2893558 RepID=UPI0021E456F0|nr:c-type cytochrome biogenesis protein CcsB [Paucibacter sp. DJ2R-2]MCV2438663.1 c-type cytochrome biogenesis protein CcsB [Paucibacter sp. DJ2R-2]
MNWIVGALTLFFVSVLVHWCGVATLSRTLGSSQAQIFGMGLATIAALPAYSVAWWRQSANPWPARLTQSALGLGASGLALRWVESYRLADGIGHVPISNLYEVFVLFVLIVGAMQLRLQSRRDLANLGAFLAPIGSAAVAFLFWYALARGGHEQAPLVPALDSYWMKLHVPANFIGYGAFCLAAMCSLAWLAADLPFAEVRLPAKKALEQASYSLIAVGFVAFTVATVLGALWAAEAWGGYWSWDPKETWALVVWLNYAAWLHLRLVGGGRRNRLLAWWSLVGLLITLFAFLGVNIYLSGLHSYGAL